MNRPDFRFLWSINMAFPKKNRPISFPAIPAKAPAPAISPTPAPVAERSQLKGSGTPKTPVTARTISQEDIARRAYEIFASRGYAAGDQNADWYEAERQLRAGL
jgi:hypothetical protein